MLTFVLAERPTFADVPVQFVDRIIALLPTNLPLASTAHVIDNDSYWKRCATERWKNCEVAEHGMSWKRLYFELNLRDALENFSVSEEEADLLEIMKLSVNYIYSLHQRQVLLHYNPQMVLGHCPNLSTLSLRYAQNKVGMEFQWDKFGMTVLDCTQLANALKESKSLTYLDLSSNALDDDKIRALVPGMLQNKTLISLKLAHNRISDRGSRAISKVLGESSVLTELDLSDNNLHVLGGKALGRALKHDRSLLSLNLRLNRLGDEGGTLLLSGVVDNKILRELNISANELETESAKWLNEVLREHPSLRVLDVSSNKFGEEGGRYIREGLEANGDVFSVDVRQCNMGEELEMAVAAAIKDARGDARKAERKSMMSTVSG